jgi:hypothetical protein
LRIFIKSLSFGAKSGVIQNQMMGLPKSVRTISEPQTNRLFFQSAG